MRIAIVTANQTLLGGAETYVRWLLGSLIERGHEVALAFECATVEPSRSLDRDREPLRRWNLEAIKRADFLTELAAFRPGVVFLQGGREPQLDLALAESFPTVLFAHGFYAACATGWRVHRFPTHAICSRRFGPACLAVNYIRGCGVRNPVQLVNMYTAHTERQRVLARLAGVVVASHYMRDLFAQHGVPQGRLHVIAPPTDFTPALAPPEPRPSPSHMLFLGRTTWGKGGRRAIEAVAEAQRMLNRPLRLTFAGDGQELASCQRLASKLGVTAEFPGWVDGAARGALLRTVDVLLVPSLWPEPFGLVGVEAASVGVPAVAFRVGGIADWLRPGVSGEFAAAGASDGRALAAALVRAIRDPAHFRELQLGAWQVAQELEPMRHVERLEGVFAGLTTRPS